VYKRLCSFHLQVAPQAAIRIAILSMAVAASPAFGQRASENVVTSAEDAFGTSIGNENIGLYSPTEARGFSPKEAGNQRMEGLYFEQLGHFGHSQQLVRSINMRVGLTAQSYPFPAPTGIADLRLRLPGSKPLTSIKAQFGPFDGAIGQVDMEMPGAGKRPGILLSANFSNRAADVPARFFNLDLAALLHWRPSETWEVIGFAQREHIWDGENLPFIFTGGPYTPPKVDRDIFSAARFDHNRTRIQWNSGFIARGMINDNWRLQAGVFRFDTYVKGDYALLYLNTQPSGMADLIIRGRPNAPHYSYSGEVRASRLFREGERRHTLHFSVRGRLSDRKFAGDQLTVYGPIDIGRSIQIQKPVSNYAPQSEDSVRHGTVGVSYVGVWPGVGEISGGLQRSYYKRALVSPVRPNTTTNAKPWLYNGTLAIEAAKHLTFYAGYTRGLEDSPIAPESAVNAGEATAATLTRQVDAGMRYKFGQSMTLVAGVFEVKKPYLDRDASGIFAKVGTLSHKGIELSLSGDPIPDLKIVTGAVFLKARVAGPAVDQGLVAKIPQGRAPVIVRLNATYGPASWRGFSVNSQVKYADSYYANRLDTAHVPHVTVVDLGARYNFNAFDATASVRFDVQNITNAYIWNVDPVSGHFVVLPARRYVVRLAADF